MKKWITILGIIAVELIAIVGALPLLGEWRREWYPEGIVWFSWSFWEQSEIALPIFVMLAVVLTVFYTRHESRIARIIAPIIITGALLLTVELVQAFA